MVETENFHGDFINNHSKEQVTTQANESYIKDPELLDAALICEIYNCKICYLTFYFFLSFLCLAIFTISIIGLLIGLIYRGIKKNLCRSKIISRKIELANIQENVREGKIERLH